MVKIIDFNHPLTLLDLQLISDELSKRENEDRNVTIVCLGKETSVDPWISDYNKKHTIGKLELIELRTDKKYGKFLIHHPPEVKLKITRKNDKAKIEIKNFISHSILERINSENTLDEIQIEDFREMIDCVLVDTDYNEKTFNIKYADFPEKRTDLVKGEYELDISKKKCNVAVKIIDMLGEEIIKSEKI